jgi:enoyl-CoA hydratase
MGEREVLIERDGGIATVVLNRPKAMNALSFVLRTQLAQAIEALAADDAVGVLILTGCGDRAFSAGLDLKELGGEGERSDGSGGDAVSSGANIVRVMEACPKPIIGAINGVAITGGFELALACDVLIGSTNARFADTHARVGIMPGWGLSQKLSRLIGIFRAKELSLTGNFLDAAQAEKWGLLNRVVEPGDLLPTCEALARDMLSCQPEMVSAYKGVIDRGYAETFGDGRRIEAEANKEGMKRVTPDRIRAARGDVMARGRTQS